MRQICVSCFGRLIASSKSRGAWSSGEAEHLFCVAPIERASAGGNPSTFNAFDTPPNPYRNVSIVRRLACNKEPDYEPRRSAAKSKAWLCNDVR